MQSNTCNAAWNTTLIFNGRSIYDSMELQLNQWERFARKKRIGRVWNIVLNNLWHESDVESDFDSLLNYIKEFWVFRKFTKCVVTKYRI